MRASVIDLGYNSLKMVSYEVSPDYTFRAYDQRGSLTRLGEGLHQTGFLSRDAIERTLRELEAMKEVNRLTKVDHVLAVATSPVREAANGAAFRAEAESVLGMRIKVLSGKEEALYSYVGAARATRLSDVLFFDLGGGSLEFTYARGYKVRKILSLPIGALRMTELYGRPGQRFTKKNYDRMRRRIAELLPSREELGINEGTSLLGVGGTIRALARYDQWTRDYPLNKLHNYRIRRKAVVALNKRLRKMSPKKAGGLEAIGKDRAGSVTAGALVIATVMNRLRFGEVVVSTHGLRDGVLSQYLGDQKGYHDERFDETRANVSLGSWMTRKTVMEALTGALASRRVLSLREKTILDEAVGSFLDIYVKTRAERLFYAIVAEDSYLDHHDQVVLATSLVRAKAPKTANWFYSRYRSILKDTRKDTIARLASFIQLAEVLEFTRSSTRLRMSGGTMRLDVTTSSPGFPALLLEKAGREIEDATGRMVKTVVHRRLEREQVVPVAGR